MSLKTIVAMRVVRVGHADTWSLGATLVMAAGAWVLFATFATDWDRQRLPGPELLYKPCTPVGTPCRELPAW